MSTQPSQTTLDLRVKIVNSKPSQHAYFGAHDLLTLEVLDAVGAIPAGLQFTLRRPHDGSADLRSAERKAKESARRTPPLETPRVNMKRDQLLALADARGVDVPDDASKAQIVALLGPQA